MIQSDGRTAENKGALIMTALRWSIKITFPTSSDKRGCSAIALEERENHSLFIKEGGENGLSMGRTRSGHHRMGQRMGLVLLERLNGRQHVVYQWWGG